MYSSCNEARADGTTIRQGWGDSMENLTQADWDASNVFIRVSQVREETKVQYARSCYAEQSSPQSSPCDFLATKRIDSSVNESANCPFSENLCGAGSALQIDTGYVNSDQVLGINAPPNNQVWFRYISTWTPIVAANFTSPWLDLTNTSVDGEKWRTYYFGPTQYANYTFYFSNYSAREVPTAYHLL